MALIPQALINEIRNKTDIVDVIEQYVPLQKRGTNYVASCPFHEDRNPSFSVSQPKQIYKCFSCQRGGNVFNFIQEIEGLSFVQAVAKVGEMVDIAVDLEEGKDDGTHQRYRALYEIHELAQTYYHYCLTSTTNGKAALDYLLDRKVTRETIDLFTLGYAPENSQLLEEYLLSKDYRRQDLIESGIFYENNRGQLVDRFAHRLIVPLKDENGRPIAFSGRIFLATQQDLPKYVNSTDTPIFNKSRLLYNYNLARTEARRQGRIIVCEGYMDVMALTQFGFSNAVATMGTALTEDHAKRLARTAKEIVFIFDGDEAGQKATLKAFSMLHSYGQVVKKSVVIPQGKDPDEWLKAKGSDSFNHLIQQGQSAYEFEKDYYRKGVNLEDRQALAAYIERMLGLISQLPSSIEQELRIQQLSQEFDLSEDLLKEQFSRAAYRMRNRQGEKDRQRGIDPLELPQMSTLIKSSKAFNSEKILLYQLVFHEQAWEFLARLGHPILFFHEWAQKLFFLLQNYYYDEGNPLPLTGITDRISDPEINQIFTGLIWEEDKGAYQDQIMRDCLAVIQRAFIEQEIEELTAKARQFRLENNQAALHKILTEIMHKTRQIKPGGQVNE